MDNYALDVIDERDYNAEELLGSVSDLPKKFFIKDDEIQNQSLDKETRMACVFFAGSSVSNTMNYIAGESTRISGKSLSAIAIKDGLLDIKKGAWVKSSPKLLKELGYITAYARCYNIYQVKLAIFNKKPVQTGTNRIDWSKTRDNNNIAVGKPESGGHSFFICGYDDEKELLVCENSYGDGKYAKGYFFIKYEDFNLLFNSKYVMTDKYNAQLTYKEKIMDNINIEKAKEGFELGLWNGKNATKPVTREECATMCMRVVELLKGKE